MRPNKLFGFWFGAILFVLNGAAQAQGQISPIPLLDVQVKAVTWASSSAPEVDSLLERAKPSLIGRHINDAGLTQIQERLTQDLRSEGYLIGQIVVSSQDRKLLYATGDLRLSVYLGEIGQIVIKNTSSVDSDWVNSVVTNTLCPDGVGQACTLTKVKFERMTQLLQDTTGLQTGVLDFSPEGMPIGQTKLLVTTVAKDSQLKGSVGVDNQGFQSTGLYRMGATVSANNVFGVGDVAALSAFVSNQGAVSGALNLSGPIASNGLRWQSLLSRSQFAVPGVNSSGFGNAASVGLAYPLIRGLDVNWTAGLNAVAVVTNSQVSGFVMTDKTLKSGQIALDGNSGDRSIGLGQSAWFVHFDLTKGQVEDSGLANAFLAPYTKLAFQGVGKLVVSDKHNIFTVINVRGQAANTNLDPYEKLLVGGASGMRAYSPNQNSFNQGALATAELRQIIKTDWGQFVPVIFVDYANGWINHTPISMIGSNASNHMALSDAGLGVDWSGLHDFTASITWARRLPMSPAGSYNNGNANSQFWFLAQSRF